MSETTVVTPKFRVSFPNVFKARTNELNGKEEYSLVALFEKGADLKALQAAVQAAIEKKWGKEKAKWPKNLRLPFRDQGDREKEDANTGKTVLPSGYEKGAYYLNLKSTQPPGVVDQAKKPIVESRDFYAGCWARAMVNAYAYDIKGNKGVALGLMHLQKVAEGEPLGGRVNVEDAFEAIEVEDQDPNSIFGGANAT